MLIREIRVSQSLSRKAFVINRLAPKGNLLLHQRAIHNLLVFVHPIGICKNSGQSPCNWQVRKSNHDQWEHSVRVVGESASRL